jgi:uncharacterized protein YndB with AHSA1/START domain
MTSPSAVSQVAPIRHEITVDAPRGDAFAAFTDGIATWWPRDYTWSGELLERVGIEPRSGGFCYEIGSGGMRLDWGRVAAWEPPHRLSFSWQVGPGRVPEVNPARASQVEVLFERAGQDRTRVTVVHDGWQRHGEAGAEYRNRFDQDGAWRRMLAAYAQVVERRRDAPWMGLST